MNLRKNLEYIREYGIYIWLISSLAEKTGAQCLYREKNRRVLLFLKKEMLPILEKYRTFSEAFAKETKGNIWTAWLQGEDRAPEVIRLCFASMRRNAGGHRVVVLSDDNINEFAAVPEALSARYEKGEISRAHYTDIVRTRILADEGGLWLDGTAFVTKAIPETVFTKPFYSEGSKAVSCQFVADGKWIVGYMGASAGSPFIRCIADMLEAFWLRHQLAIDYFVFDYLLALLYQENADFRNTVDNLQKVTVVSTGLKQLCNEAFDERLLSEKLSQRQFYYLTYRTAYLKEDMNGAQTNYAYLYKEYLGE